MVCTCGHQWRAPAFSSKRLVGTIKFQRFTHRAYYFSRSTMACLYHLFTFSVCSFWQFLLDWHPFCLVGAMLYPLLNILNLLQVFHIGSKLVLPLYIRDLKTSEVLVWIGAPFHSLSYTRGQSQNYLWEERKRGRNRILNIYNEKTISSRKWLYKWLYWGVNFE